MATRQMAGKRITHSASFLNRKVTPGGILDVSIHSSEVDDQKVTLSNKYKQEKLAAGIRATNDHDYVEAVKHFSLIKPDTTTSLYLAGCARLELQHYSQTQEAIVDFTKCIELSSQAKQPLFGLEVWYKRALAYHNINKYDEAIKDYKEFIHQCRSLDEKGASELPRGLIGRGLTYQTMYELDMAMKNMNEANRLTKNSIPYYLCCRASVHTSKYEREKAMEDIERATNLGCDKNVEALFQRAIVLAELGRHNAALEDLKKALSLTPKPIQQSDICFRCGMSEYSLNDKEQAFQWFQRAITLHPFNAQAYYRLGMMQIEKGQYKEALKTLNRAQELAPQQGDILLERAIVNQHLGKLDDAAHDRKRGMQMNSSSFAIIPMLGDRIIKLREERDHNGVSPRNHLELAMAYDGLLSQKKDLKVKMEYYKIAVMEYRAVIETDTKYLYPQVYALLALCQKKMNNLIEAHESHLEFYNVLSKYKGAIYHWKKYLLDVKDKMELNKIEPHLDENAVSKLIQMELNRRKREIDEETFLNDIQDKYKNQLAFYEQMRIDLSNVLAAIAVLNLDSKIITDNIEDIMHKVAKIVELLSEGEISVSAIELALNSNTKINPKVLRKVDYNMVKMRLKLIGNVGDMADQLDVAQLVARHLCTRYHSQLICLKPKNEDSDDDEIIAKESSSWWKCCGGGGNKWFSSKISTFSDGKEIIRKLSTFAIAFIIHTINSETIKVSSNSKSARKDALATTLVLIVCQAHPNSDTRSSSSLRHENEKLSINLTEVSEMLRNSQVSNTNESILPIEWHLYAFFRAPGIYYYSENDTGKIRYYGSSPSMISNVYGYRLGTKEEVDVFKRLTRED